MNPRISRRSLLLGVSLPLLNCGDSTSAQSGEPLTVGDPEILFQSEVTVELALDATHLYWPRTGGGVNAIVRAPKDGGPVEVLTVLEKSYVSRVFLVDDTWVYFLDYETLKRVPKTGGEPERIDTLEDNLHIDATQDDTSVWILRVDGEGFSKILQFPKNGGEKKTLYLNAYPPFSYHEGFLYFTAGGAIQRLPTAGGAPQSLSPIVGAYSDFAFSSTHVFFTMFSTGTVRRLSLNGGEHEVLSSHHDHPRRMVLNRGNAFFSMPSDGEIRSVNQSGGAGVIAANQPRPYALAQNETHLYWAGEQEGGIRRIALR